MKDKLITKNYIEILAANFLLFFGFWLLMPVLPFYLAEVFDANKTTIGAVLSCYTIAALCIRPFSGYLLDTFARKPLYLLAYFTFTAIFGGYLIAGTLTLFILFRIIHGVSFGMVTVADKLAVSIGPMTGLFLHDAGADYTLIFCCSLGSCLIGFLCASLVKTTYKPPVKREPISLDRFILLKGIPAGFSLLLLSIPYGMTTNYVARQPSRPGNGYSSY